MLTEAKAWELIILTMCQEGYIDYHFHDIKRSVRDLLKHDQVQDRRYRRQRNPALPTQE